MRQSLLKATSCRSFLFMLLTVASVGLFAQPANDMCDGAIALTVGTDVTGTTVGASPETLDFCGTGDGTGGGVWYSYTPTEAGVATFSLCGSGFDTRVRVYSGACDALVCEGGNDDSCGLQSETTVGVTAGTEYKVFVHGFGASEGAFTLATTFDLPPANDNCDAAQVVANMETVTGTTAIAGPDVAPTCGTTDGTGGGVWYSFTPDITGNATFSLCNSSFDTKVRVYTGACDALECVDGNDDACGVQSSVTIDATAGTEYLILVHGFGGNSGDFELIVTAAVPPANDDCDNAEAVVIDGTVAGTTNGAAGSGLDFCNGFTEGTGGTVWYQYTTTVAGSLTVNTCEDTEFDTQIAVFTGSCAALACTDNNDDFCGAQSQVTTIEVGPGEDFFVAVTGFGANAGNFNIAASFDTCTAEVICATEVMVAIGPDGTTALDSSIVLDPASSFCIGDQLAIDVDMLSCADQGEVVVTGTFTPGAGSLAEPTTCVVTLMVTDTTPPVIDAVFAPTAQIEDDMATLTLADVASATDNCELVSLTAEPLTFSCLDDGIVTVTATDANGNVSVEEVRVFILPEAANVACYSEVNLTLNDDCVGLMVPSMVLAGQSNCLDNDLIRIVVQDDDPSNGPIVDGCGTFIYTVIPPDGADVNGFNGADWTITSDETDDQTARSRVTSDSLVLATLGGTSTTSGFSISASYMFASPGTASFDYAYNGIDSSATTFFDDALIVYDFDGNVVETVLDANMPARGSSSIEVQPGYSLVITLTDDGFAPILNGGDGTEFSVIALTNFELDAVVVGEFPFTGCWGYVNAEDKTPPAVVSTPDDLELLCVDFENDQNNLSTLPATVSRCYRVNSATGATIPGTMAPALRARLLARTSAPIVPLFTDGCTDEIEVCVNDAVAFGADPSCDDIVITRTFTATEISTCPSESGESNPSVVASYEVTFVRPTLADLDGDNIEPNVNYDRCGVVNPTRADYPLPRPGDFPFLQLAGRNFPLMNGQATCNIGVTYSDGDPIETCLYTYKFVRTYTVIDWCDPSDVRTFTQVVKVGDEVAPVFTGPNVPTNAAGDLIFGTNAGNQCAAFIRLDNISVVDGCSGTNVTVTAEVYPNGNLAGAPIGAFAVVPGGAPELTTAIPAGRHILRYRFKDVCGNTGVQDYFIIVEDQTPPVAICEDGLNISIAGGTNDGFAVLTADEIDAGSYDDCSPITRSIARVNNNNLEIGTYGPEIRLTCADLGMVRVGLRISDGVNVNFCWLEVLVEDKLPPTCVAPGPVTINCDEYNESLPSDIMDASAETLNALFGTAAGVDNCGTTITQTIVGDVNSCGVGSFRRTFTSTDDAGFTNTNFCFQDITVVGVHDYQLTFPTDESGDCAIVPEFNGIGVDELGCDLITTTRDIDTLRTQLAGEECFKLRIEYDVINWCEYNSLGEPYIIPRDADGALNRNRQTRDLEEDELYVNIIPRTTTGANADDDDFGFISLRNDRSYNPGGAQNDQPLGDNGEGDINDDNTYGTNVYDSRGFFRYTQFVKIYDEVAPEITFEPYEECFVGNSAECTTTVELEFTATDQCSDASVVVELDPNYVAAAGFVAGSVPGVAVSVSNDDDGNFTVTATNVPAGQHAIRVSASDGCGNFDVQIIEFCVTADRTPTPICIQTLTVVLADDGNGGGIAAIWASDFIASPIADCEGNEVTKYSLYRAEDPANANPQFNPPSTDGIDDIDCDDASNGTVRVRVYAFDDLGSEPNFCEVVVEVQDNANLCNDSGDLSGQIATDENEVLEGVAVSLTGGNDMDVTAMTDANGNFNFTNLPLGADYTIQPSFDAPFNARQVKSSDLAYIIGNILGTSEFDSPYDYIAADVDGNREMNIFDVVTISKLILGIETEFEGGNWVFVRADATIDMSNPYGEAFPEVYNVNDLEGDLRNVSFIGVEKGNPFTEAGRSASVINVEDAQLEAGQTHTMVLDGAELFGFQGTIELAAGLELVSADFTGEGAINLNRAGEGMIAVAVRENAAVTLEVRATTAGRLSELVNFTDAITYREGVTLNGSSNALALDFTNGIATGLVNALGQNVPNPVAETTRIDFTLAEAGQVTLSILDVQGRTVLVRELEGVAGQNVTTLNVSDLGNASGVLSYTLTAGKFSATKQMIVVR